MTGVRDLTPQEIAYVDREVLAKRVSALQAERGTRHTNLKAALTWAAGEYERCIVSARCTTDSHHYEKCNGRAEAYRQLVALVAEAAGLAVPDWEAIKAAVPPDGIYR
jgi:hypothetical protein